MRSPLLIGVAVGRQRRVAKWIGAGVASSMLIFLLPVVLLAGAGNPPCQAMPAPGPGNGGSGGFSRPPTDRRGAASTATG